MPEARRVEGPSYLAIDLGATSGRAVVGVWDGGCMHLREVHRFDTPLVESKGHLVWDLQVLWAQVVRGVTLALELDPTIRSISVDSWAVDYVPIGTDGLALRHPYCYRDQRTVGRLGEAVRRLGLDQDALYARTGTQFLELNTLAQVVADLADEPELVAATAKRLLIADYILYRLSGEIVAERTIASTTQLLDATSGEWAEDLIEGIGDDPRRWPRLVDPGTVLGPLVGVPRSAPPVVIATCSHDTAAAVAAVPAEDGRPWAFISSGTWSLIGSERPAPVLTPTARQTGFTNELGLDGTVRLLKNRTGLWVIEECLRAWGLPRTREAMDGLMAAAAAELESDYTIDLDGPAFRARGDMPGAIEQECRAGRVAPPAHRGGLVRLVLDSLAASYRRTLLELDTLTGAHSRVVHIVGGGSRNALLNQLTATVTRRLIVNGPDEATVLGNLLVQARTLGDLGPGKSVRQAARASVGATSRLSDHLRL
jgi:rhamnulokinase